MEGLSPLESIDSNADLFSNVALKLTATPAVTGYDCNSTVSTGIKRRSITSKIPAWFQKWDNSDFNKQSTNSGSRSHKFRFWLNEKDDLDPSEDQLFSSPEDISINTQASIYNDRISLDLFPDDEHDENVEEIGKTSSSQASIYEFDYKELEFLNVPSTDATFTSQVSIYQLGGAADAEPSIRKANLGHSSILHAPIYGFDEPDLIFETPREDDHLLKECKHTVGSDITLNTPTALYELSDEKYYLESLQDVLMFGKGMNDVVNAPVGNPSSIYGTRMGHNSGTAFEVFLESCLDTDSSWEAYEAEYNKTSDAKFGSSVAKRKSRLRTLLHYLKNKFSNKRIVSEMQLLKTLWHSILISRKNAYEYYHYC